MRLGSKLSGSGSPVSHQVPVGQHAGHLWGCPASGEKGVWASTHREGQLRGHAVRGAAQQEGTALLEGDVSAHLLQEQPQDLSADTGLHGQCPPQGAGVAAAGRGRSPQGHQQPQHHAPHVPTDSAPARWEMMPNLTSGPDSPLL